jgi:hypothetical protein
MIANFYRGYNIHIKNEQYLKTLWKLLCRVSDTNEDERPVVNDEDREVARAIVVAIDILMNYCPMFEDEDDEF